MWWAMTRDVSAKIKTLRVENVIWSSGHGVINNLFDRLIE